MIECKSIANVYKFKCKCNDRLYEYLTLYNHKALVIISSEDVNYCDVYIYDTFNRQAYNAYYDLKGEKIRRIDSDAMLEILVSLGIDVERYNLISIEGLKNIDERSV